MLSRRPSMLDVARAAGVSKNTVSLAFRHDPQIPLATRERIFRAAKELGYERNATVSHLMAELRLSSSGAPRTTLALLNAHSDRHAFSRHPTVPEYVCGCRRRATALGYGLDEFWLGDPKWDGDSLAGTLRARGIRGLVAVGLMDENRLPSRFASLWQKVPCVVTGVRTREPALSFACVDHHNLARSAVEQVIAHGYRRPGLVIDSVIDDLVDGRFSAGFTTAQRALTAKSRIRPFFDVAQNRRNPRLFENWFRRQQPDAILTLYTEVRSWLDDLRPTVMPGLVQLEWRPREPHWAGMNQHNDIAGEAAIDMLVAMIQNGEVGIPAFPRATLIGSTWMPGVTLPCERSSSPRKAASQP